MRFRTIALSLIPGAAHVDLGRAGRGLLVFSLFAFSVNAALVAPLVLGVRSLRTIGAVAAGVLWIAALIDALRLAARQDRKKDAVAPAGAPPPQVGKPVA